METVTTSPGSKPNVRMLSFEMERIRLPYLLMSLIWVSTAGAEVPSRPVRST